MHFFVFITTLSSVAESQDSPDEVAKDLLVFFSVVNDYRKGADTDSELLFGGYTKGVGGGVCICAGARVNKYWVLTSKTCAKLIKLILLEGEKSKVEHEIGFFVKLFSKDNPKGIGYITVTANIISDNNKPIALIGIESAESASGYLDLSSAEEEVNNGDVKIIGRR
ncbi:hypothetical protein [Endozoicomonas sp. ALD040]|uniref:hypothetical protein n=1 Tax=Endozoicomonas sp. ALD040 TaxID=3403079 RepID=UPI003BAFBB63